MKQREPKVIEVSAEHKTLRTVIFVLVFIVAVAGLTYGILSIWRKKPGWESVVVNPDSQTTLYSQQFHAEVFLSGTQSEMKSLSAAVRSLYSASLSEIWKTLDPADTYDGIIGLGLLNSRPGETFTVTPALMDILTDALRRTQAGEGFNMFAGALYSEYRSILISEFADQFDPLFNSNTAERVGKLAEAVNDLSNFSLVLDPENLTASFSVSAEYERLMADMEITAPALDLNLLRDAYILDYVAAAFAARDIKPVVLYANDGAAVSLLQAAGGTDFHAAALTDSDLYYYTVSDGGRDYYRHIYFDSRTGAWHDLLLSGTVLGSADSLIEACYAAILLNCCSSEAQIRSVIARYPSLEFEYTLF